MGIQVETVKTYAVDYYECIDDAKESGIYSSLDADEYGNIRGRGECEIGFSRS